MGSLRIGEVAARTGLTAPTIRYYESVGLLRSPARSASGYRHYSEQTVEELVFIKKGQALGFSLDELAQILTLSRAGRTPCTHVLTMARRHLAAVEERIRQFRRFGNQLAAELAKWEGKPTPTCHGLCKIIASADPEPAIEHVDLTSRRPPRKSRR